MLVSKFFTNRCNFKISGILAIILAASFFGLYPPLAKIAYSENVSQSFLIIFTTLIRALCLIISAMIFQGQKFSKIIDFSKDSIVSGIFQAISIIGIIVSLKYIPGPVMITIVFSHTIMLLFYSAFQKKIKIDSLVLLTSFSALIGISLVVDLYSHTKSINLQGVLWALLAAVATALRFFAFGELAKTIPSIVVGARALFYATIFTLPLILFQNQNLAFSNSGIFASIFCALSLALGSVFSFYALSKIDAFRISFLLKIEPIFTSLYSYLILSEVLGIKQYLGILLVIFSLVFYEIYRKK